MDTAEPIDGVEVGEVLGGYRLDRLLGAGSVSRVFLGEHVKLGRKAAIKVLLAKMIDDQRVIDRFLNEARVVNDIRHPNIVDVSDFIETEAPRRLALVMEYIEGPSLKKVIRKGRPLSFVQACGIVLQLADACAAAHGAGVIHRDIKPDNLLLTSDPDDPAFTRDQIPGLKVVDFGIAKILGPGEKTATGMMIGTPAYMAPEQIAGKPAPSAATDVFAIGEVLYEMLTGERAYPAAAVGAMVQIKLKGEPPKLSMPFVPGGAAILDLIHRCLLFRQQDRPKLEEITRTLLEVCPEARGGTPRDASKPKPSSEADTIEPPASELARAMEGDAFAETAPPTVPPSVPPFLFESAPPTAPAPIASTAAAPLPRGVPTAVAPLPPGGVAMEEPPDQTVTPIIIREPANDRTAVSPFHDSTTVVKSQHGDVAPRPRSPLMWIAAALSIAAVITAVALTARVDQKSSSVEMSGATAMPEPSAAVTPVPHARVERPRSRVEIDVTPTGAIVEDAATRVVFGVTPLVLELTGAPNDPKRLRISLSGYEPIEVPISGNTKISAELTKQAAATKSPRPAKRTPGSAEEKTPPGEEGFPSW